MGLPLTVKLPRLPTHTPQERETVDHAHKREPQSLSSPRSTTSRNGLLKVSLLLLLKDQFPLPLKLTPRPSKVKKWSAESLVAAIAQGPVSVTVEADTKTFQGYTGGIMNSSACGTSLDHAITAVGYGVKDGQQYYIVRNSWGLTWGDAGYINIATQTGWFARGICGIQQTSVYPNMK